MTLVADSYRVRASRLRDLAGQRSLDALIVYSAPLQAGFASQTSGHTLYLANWQNPAFPAALVLPLHGDATLFGASMVYARGWAKRKELWVERQYEFVEPTSIKKALKDAGVPSGRIGFIGRSEMAAPVYEALASEAAWRFEDADELMVELKLDYDDGEIALGRQAVANADAMLAALVSGAREGRWAYEVAADMRNAAFQAGSDFADVWIGNGPAAVDVAMIAWQARRRIEEGDLLHGIVFDSYDGRHAQLIRTGVKGTATPEQRHYVDVAIQAQEAGFAALTPGRPLINCARAIQDAISELTPHRFGTDPVQSRCGHLQGVQYAEPGVSDPFIAYLLPDTRAAERVTVREGMRLVIHPNFSVPGLGWFSVGDNVLVTRNGVERLSQFPRECFEA
jgi:Xaa-Pro dipeptidase